VWSALRAIIVKEYRQTFRDKRMVALLVVAPMLQLLVLGFAVNLEVEHVPTVVADQDHSPASRQFTAGLMAGDAFDLKGTVDSGRDAERLVEQGKVPITIIIPRGFSRRLAQGRKVSLQALVDGGDSNRAIVAQNAVVAYAMQMALAQAEAQLTRLSMARGTMIPVPRVRVEPRIMYNPTLNSQVYFVPGIAATLLLVITMITTAMGLAREKEMGTLEQVMVTPVRPEILILGKTLPYGLIGLIDLGLVVALGAWVFDVPIRGSLLLIFLAGGVYMLTTLGLGLFVSVLARTQQQAFMVGMLIMMPSILLSGFMTPVENMPGWLQPLSALTPVRHFVEILRSVLLKNGSLTELSAQFVALAGMGISIFLLAAFVLRRRLA